MSTKDDIRYALNSLIAEKGVKKSDLADALGVSKGAVTNWSNGSNSIDIELIPSICEFFDVTIDEFFGRKQPEKESLTENELRLLFVYRNMDAAGQEALMASAEGLYSSFSFEAKKEEEYSSPARRYA